MRNEKGSSVLELALLIPLLVVLLVGITELSRMFSAAMGVSQAARAGAANTECNAGWRPRISRPLKMRLFRAVGIYRA